MALLRDTLSSMQFLSRLPVHLVHSVDDDENALPDFQTSAYAFPIAGALIALPSAFLLWGALTLGFSATVSALLGIACMVIVTGALHEDGLADVADGFWGGHTLERKLAIMRDSSIGTYGVLALILSVGLRVSLVASIAQTATELETALAFVAICALSRAAILFPWYSLLPARTARDEKRDENDKETSGLSARYGGPDFSGYLKGVLLSLPFLLLIWLLLGFWPMIFGLAFLKLSAFAATRLSKHHIGGHTGDTLGATQQICELGLLLGLVIAM